MEKYNLDSATPYIEKLLDRIEVLENALKEINSISSTGRLAEKDNTYAFYLQINEIAIKALWPV